LLSAIILAGGATVMESASTPAPKGDIRLDPQARSVTQLKNLRVRIRMASLEKSFGRLQGNAHSYEDAADQMPSMVQFCLNDMYTVQNQTAAGCVASDTVGQCRDKLLRWCMAQVHSSDGHSVADIKRLSKRHAAEAREFAKRVNEYAEHAERFANSLPQWP